MRKQSDRLTARKYFLFLSIGLLTALPFPFVQGKDPLLEPVFIAQPLGDGSTSKPLTFGTAIQGGGSSTSILFTQGVLKSVLGALTAFATFTSPSGDVIETRSTELSSNSTRSITFTGDQNLQAGCFALLLHDHGNHGRVVCGALHDVLLESLSEGAVFADHEVILRDRKVRLQEV